MIAAIIRACIANRLLVLLIAVALIAGGVHASRVLTVDAIPDLSDVQVIIRTDWPGQAPEVMEDQVTFPIASAMLAVPGAETVRAVSMFNDSFIYVIFRDGTDPYWARARVAEQLATLDDALPADAQPQLGPDASGIGWIYQYVLTTGRYSPDHPQGWWYDAEKEAWYGSLEAVPQDRRQAVELRRIVEEEETRWIDPLTGLSWTDPELAPEHRRGELKPLTTSRHLDRDPITGTKLVESDVDLSELRAIQDWFLRFELTAIPGVSEVATAGGWERQYQITVDPNVLLAYDMDMEHIAQAVARHNADTGGRSLERGGFELMIRSRGYLGDITEEQRHALAQEGPLAVARARSAQVVQDLASIPLRVDGRGVPLQLGQIATIREGPQIRSGMVEWNGQGETVGGIVVMRYEENARAVIARIHERMDELRLALPPGVDVAVAYDRSDLIDRAIATLQRVLIQEIAVVSCVVFLFLMHARSALVAVVVLPTAVLAAVIAMHALGINANIMSLGGIAIAIGVMVDSSIIMVEAAHRALEEDRHRQAAGEPARNRMTLISEACCGVGPALFASLLIITISFLPIFVLTGQSGRLFTPLAWTKTLAMAAAALLSISLIPVLVTLLVGDHSLPRQWSRQMRRWCAGLVVVLPAILLAVLPWEALAGLRWWLVVGWVVVAIVVLMPQRLFDEERHVLTRWLRTIYNPFFAVGMQWPRLTLLLAGLVVLATWMGPVQKLGQEFMPPLEEGDFLYMPNTDRPPSATNAQQMLQVTDAIFASFPEVTSVKGKIGRAETATDPAPMTMIETTIQLERDRSRWRQVPERRFFGLWNTTRPITLDELTDGYELPGGTRVPGINDALTIPGLYGSLTRGALPIRTRIDMLATGFRTPVGIKLMGDDLATLDRLAEDVRAAMQSDPALAERTRDISTEPATGGRYIDIRPDRHALARHGISMEAFQAVVGAALGGRTLTMTVEGRERYSVNLRYPRELRDRPQDLSQVLLRGEGASLIPLGQVAEIIERDGPPMIRSENARLSSWLYVTPEPGDVVGYVRQAQAVIRAQVDVPTGYSVVWAGTYEQVLEANERLSVAIPLTLLIIVAILLLHLRSVLKTALIFCALSFSVVGAVWMVFILGFDVSVAVMVGIVALLGLDAETSLVMMHYQDEAIAKARREGRLNSDADLRYAVYQGAVQRIRPKIMTVLTTIVGLMPLMFATGAGADTMRRLAAPMIGGLVTSTIMELILLPAAYYLIQRWYRNRSPDDPLAIPQGGQ
ncbi:MAG: efflux RND transporter permease subunit [Planctomycetota bacterium]|nr:MAG: efflux RND transporter permease subunit [Planctomycetota bacterium]